MFGFVSTLVLVPAFMMWLARYCENMTKKAVAKEQEANKAKNQSLPQPTDQSTVALSNKPTMAGFIGK